jgi:hypothetical protein
MKPASVILREKTRPKPASVLIADVATRCKCSRSLVHFWMRGVRVPSDEQQDVLQKEFGIPKRWKANGKKGE